MDSTCCVREKKLTGNINPQYVKASNGRWMMKLICASCGAHKMRFVKERKGGKMDIYKGLSKMVGNRRLPFQEFKGEMHLPGGYAYCGPKTALNRRLARGNQWINRLDRVCRTHDIDYRDSGGDIMKKHQADQEMIQKINNFKNPMLN